MSQTVKLSDELVLDARTLGGISERLIASQVEFWARLGKAIEPLIRGDRALALKRSEAAHSLSSMLESVPIPEIRG